MNLDDFPARVVQHEYDHIDGVLFIDRMSDTKRREYDAPLADFETAFHKAQQTGEIAEDDALKHRLRELEPRE